MKFNTGDVVRVVNDRHLNLCERDSDGVDYYFLWHTHDHDCVRCFGKELFTVGVFSPSVYPTEIIPVEPLLDNNGNPVCVIEVDICEVVVLSPLEQLALSL